MFLRRNLRNFENNVKFSFSAVKKDIDNTHNLLDSNRKGILENKSNFEVLRKDLEIFKEDTEEALDGITKVINNLKGDYLESMDNLNKEMSEFKKLIEVKSEDVKEAKSEFKSEIKNLNKKLNDIEDDVKVLKPQEELSVENIFKEETNKSSAKIIIAVVVIVIVIAIIGYGIYALF